ncbi:MAG: hypothetical protein NT153_09310 [Bacteroidetes bacterium]|nr:hypothetical protein [Bacteroidota bacterium]
MKYIKITFLFILSILSSSLVLEAQSDSATSNKSYFKFSGTYLSNFIYNGRQDSITTPYITPSLGYYNKSGFYVIGSLSYLSSAKEKRLDLFSIDIGYDFSISKKLMGSVYANKSAYNQSSTAIQSDVKGSIGAYFNYDFNFLEFNTTTDITFANKTDIGVNMGLLHTFSFGEKLNSFTLTPSVSANWSTLHFYEGYTNRKLSRLAIFLNPSSVSTTTVNNSKMTLMDYEISIPLNYEYKNLGFFINPTVALPQNPIYTTTTTVNKQPNGTSITIANNSTPKSETTLSNSFFVELGFYIKF